MKNKKTTDRRGFLGSIAAGATMAGIAPVLLPLNLYAEEHSPLTAPADDVEAWFNKIKGKHRMVFDVTHPNEILPFALATGIHGYQ